MEGGAPLHYPMLTSSNYSTWVIKMEACLEVQDVWEVIEPMADVTVEKKDKMVRTYLLQSVLDTILQQLVNKKTAKEVWDCLKTMFLGAAYLEE